MAGAGLRSTAQPWSTRPSPPPASAYRQAHRAASGPAEGRPGASPVPVSATVGAGAAAQCGSRQSGGHRAGRPGTAGHGQGAREGGGAGAGAAAGAGAEGKGGRLIRGRAASRALCVSAPGGAGIAAGPLLRKLRALLRRLPGEAAEQPHLCVFQPTSRAGQMETRSGGTHTEKSMVQHSR